MSKVVDKLKTAGIKAEAYKRGPLGKDAFAVSIAQGVIRLWEGAATVEVKPDKRHRQAVLQVKEDERTITRNVRFRMWSGDEKPASQLNSEAEAAFRNVVQIPRGRKVKYTVKDMKKVGTAKKPPDKLVFEDTRWQDYTATVTAKIAKGSTQHLLVGVDEKENFIAELPKAAKSVAEAHRLLRPANVPANAPRQGEWFFVPVSKELNEQLIKYATGGRRRVSQQQLEIGSSHWAMQLATYKGARYVVGYVYDERASHHNTIFLDQWHKVVRNKERTAGGQRTMAAGTPRPQRQYWD